MRDYYCMTTRRRKTPIILAAGLIVLALLILVYSVFEHFYNCRFFERKTKVSLAAFKNVKTYEYSTYLGTGWVTVIGQIPHERMDSFIKEYGFIQFNPRYYVGELRLDGLTDEEEKLFFLQQRLFGSSSSRSHFYAAPKNLPPPDGNVYFLYLSRQKHMFLDKVTGTFWGFVGYG